MAEEVFNDNIKKALEYAEKLNLTGESKLSKELCVKTVKKAADYYGVDMIELFYGRKAYDRITDVSVAAAYVFIAKCAAKAYAEAYAKKAAGDKVSPWAIRDNASDKPLAGFFGWLQRRDRPVNKDDCNKFKVLLNALKRDKLYFKMSDRVAALPLVEILRRVVNGSVVLQGEELI